MPSGHLTVRTLVVVVALTAVACAPQPAAPVTELDTTGMRIDALHDEMEAVVAAQRAAEPALSQALAAAQEVTALVASFRAPDTIADGRQRLPTVAATARAVDVHALRPPIHEIAFAVDDARAALAQARDALPDPSDRAYLDAEDAVLAAVRRYAEAADALAQVIEGSWPTYLEAVARTQAFVDGREVYRDDDEASDAYEVRIHDLLDELRAASARIATFQERREDAAAAVNAASAVASERWRQRAPLPAPSVSP